MLLNFLNIGMIIVILIKKPFKDQYGVPVNIITEVCLITV